MVSKIPFLVFPLLWMMSIINVNVCLESNGTFQIILVDSLFTLSWGMADLLFVWQPLPFTTCRREVEWIYIINIFGLTTLSVQRVCIYFYFCWVISVSVFGRVNNFAVVVGPTRSVWVSRIRGASSSTLTSLNPLFRVETLAGWDGVHHSSPLLLPAHCSLLVSRWYASLISFRLDLAFIARSILVSTWRAVRLHW